MSEQGEKGVLRGPTIWHPAFYELLIDGAPPTTEIDTEIELARYPLRADLLFIRRIGMTPRDDEATVLRGLWPRLSRFALAEFKGPTVGYLSGDLLRLLGYGVQLQRISRKLFKYASDLTLVLITPAETRSFLADIKYMGWRFEHLRDGYARVTGASYDILAAFTDEVHKAEHDELLSLFSRTPSESHEAGQWLSQFYAKVTDMKDADKLEGFEELTDRLLQYLPPERILKAIPAELRAGSLSPDERVRGLSPDERIRGLSPDELVRLLSPDKLARLRKLIDESE